MNVARCVLFGNGLFLIVRGCTIDFCQANVEVVLRQAKRTNQM
jgi:hypothetical protein